MLGNSMRENRETPLVSGSSMPDRLEKATSDKTSVYASGELDERAVPTKYPNNGGAYGGKPFDQREHGGEPRPEAQDREGLSLTRRRR
jgi:hypothetical protein